MVSQIEVESEVFQKFVLKELKRNPHANMRSLAIGLGKMFGNNPNKVRTMIWRLIGQGKLETTQELRFRTVK